MSETTKLTPEQVHEISETIDNETAESTAVMDAACKETEETKYDESTAISAGVNIPGVQPIVPTAEESKSNYVNAMKQYDLSEDEAMKMFNIITAYKSGERKGLYNMMPTRMKIIIDEMAANGIGHRLNKDTTAGFLIESLVNDAEFEAAFDEYTRAMSEVSVEIDSEFSAIMKEAMEDTFDRIEEIRAEDPDKANRIQSVKDAFAKAENFDVQLAYLDRMNAKKLNKLYNRMNYELEYFNKRVNTTEIKVPDITQIPGIISTAVSEVSSELAWKFALVIAESTMKLPIDMGENLANLAYIYRLIENIYKYKYAAYTGSMPEAYFNQIKEVISKIDTL